MNKSISTFIITLVVYLFILQPAYSSDSRLTVPENLITLNSINGINLLKKAPINLSKRYWDLSPFFVTEKGLAYCAPAAIVMVLNAMGKVPNIAPEHYPYKIFNQDNLFYNSSFGVHFQR